MGDGILFKMMIRSVGETIMIGRKVGVTTNKPIAVTKQIFIFNKRPLNYQAFFKFSFVKSVKNKLKLSTEQFKNDNELLNILYNQTLITIFLSYYCT